VAWLKRLAASNCAARRGGHSSYSRINDLVGKCAFPPGGIRVGRDEGRNRLCRVPFDPQSMIQSSPPAHTG